MEQQIDLLMRFHTSNRLIYENLINDAKKKNGIMPFVGEALSQCTFGSRDDFVREVQERTPNWKTDNKKECSITFLDMLDSLIQIHKKGIIDQRLLSFYSDLKIDDRYMKNQAISLIPYINGHHCITANLDHAIDHSYAIAGKMPDVTHPFERKKLNTLVRGGIDSTHTNIILKIHGDILSDSDQRIITKQEYKKHYRKSSTFYSAISQWIQNYTILFIGVDICKDRYLFDLLKQLNSPGVHHYAIIGCSADSKSKENTVAALDEIGILPILYDESAPEGLEMLLHKFLVDTDNIPHFSMGEIDYKYSQQNLVGRDKQMDQLISFLNSDKRFLWTIIKGNRLTGRTKLAFDFSRLHASDWEWYLLEPEEVDDFLTTQIKIQRERKKNRNLLITFDNFHWYKGSLSKIFESETCLSLYSQKIRLIFILHDIKHNVLWDTLSNSQRDSLWFTLMDSVDRSGPITIGQLSVEEIMQLCHGYIHYRGYQLGIEQKLDQVFTFIDDELRQFIRDLLEKNIPNILSLSQLKVLNLVKKYNGTPYLKDSELGEEIFQLTVTLDHPSPHIQDFNYDNWLLDITERNKNVSLTKEYLKNKEMHKESEIYSHYEDREVTSLWKDLGFDYDSKENGDEHH